MQRTLQPELLDSLPPDHPAAIHNRRDLRIINALMGTHRWLQRALVRSVRPGEAILELGAGTGEFGRRLRARGLAVDGLDLWPRPADWPVAAAWHREDLRTFRGYPAYPVVIGNLILHQFTDAELAELGAILRRHARVIAAVEPERQRLFQTVYRWVAPLFGANAVSLHDGHVSIAAGFRGRELIERLGLDDTTWRIERSSTPLGAHRLLAIRRT